MKIKQPMAPALLSPDEYQPYYEAYLKLLPRTGSPEEVLRRQWEEDISFWKNWADIQEPYAPGKWSPARVLQHLIDTERTFQFRALTLARGDSRALPGFDHKAYAEKAPALHRSLEELLEEWWSVRQSGMALFRSLKQPEILRQTGTIDGEPLSVRAAAYIPAGHARHHRQILEQHCA